MNPLRAHTTPIPTPLWVRLGGSALAGAAVAVGTSRIHFGLAMGLSLLFLLAACALVLLHPYRADLRDYAQRHNVTMLPNAAQLIPLMALWLMVMFSPLLALPAWGSARSGYSFQARPSSSSPTSTAPASSPTHPLPKPNPPRPGCLSQVARGGPARELMAVGLLGLAQNIGGVCFHRLHRNEQLLANLAVCVAARKQPQDL